MTKYALIGLLAVCATVLCFSLIFRERLCELNIHRGNTVVQVTLAYERSTEVSCRAGTEVPAFRKCEVFQGQTPGMSKTAGPARSRPGPASWLIRHFQLFSHFIIKITLNGRNQT